MNQQKDWLLIVFLVATGCCLLGSCIVTAFSSVGVYEAWETEIARPNNTRIPPTATSAVPPTETASSGQNLRGLGITTLELWLLFVLGAWFLTFVADIIRCFAEKGNLFSTLLWLGSIYLLYQGWDNSPWRQTYPEISLVVFLIAYLIVGFVELGPIYFIRHQLSR